MNKLKLFIIVIILIVTSNIHASLLNKKIGVDPGHGSINTTGGSPDPGAVGCCNEADFTLATSLKLRDYLVKDSAVVVMTSETEVRPSLTNRVAIFNSNNVHSSVCIHNNSASATAHGVEIFYCSLNAQTAESKIFAGKILNRELAIVKNDSRNVKECWDAGRSMHFTMVRDPVCVAILSENYFISNSSECETIIKPDSGRQLCAKAHYYGICDYYGVIPQDVDTTPPSVPTLISPANNTITTVSTPNFDWSDVSDPSGVKYQLQLSNNTNFSSTIMDLQNLTSSQYKISTTLSNGTYYWRVRAADNLGNIGVWSSTSSFVINKITDIIPPQNPTKITAWVNVTKSTEILNNTWQKYSDTPYFEWSGATDTISGIAGYSIYWGTNSAGVPNENVITASNYFQVSTPSVSGTEYYLRIRTKDNSDNWSTAATLFIIKYMVYGLPEIVLGSYDKIGYLGKDVLLTININGDAEITDTKLEYCINDDWANLKESELTAQDISYNGIEYISIINGIDVTTNTISITYRVKINNNIILATATINVQPNLEKVIGPVGGTVELTDGDSRDGTTKVVVPSGIIDNYVKIGITLKDVNNVSAVPAATGNVMLTKTQTSPIVAYEIEPSGQMFNDAVELTFLYYNTSSVLNENNLRVFWYDGSGWRYIGGGVDKVKKTVSVKVNHFSLYGVFEINDESSNNVENYRPREKIITPDKDGKNDYAYFSGIMNYAAALNSNDSTVVEINIYNLKNQKIRVLSSTEIWDGLDDNGEQVENGVYIYQYKLDGKTVTGTIVVAK